MLSSNPSMLLSMVSILMLVVSMGAIRTRNLWGGIGPRDRRVRCGLRRICGRMGAGTVRGGVGPFLVGLGRVGWIGFEGLVGIDWSL